MSPLPPPTGDFPWPIGWEDVETCGVPYAPAPFDAALLEKQSLTNEFTSIQRLIQRSLAIAVFGMRACIYVIATFLVPSQNISLRLD